MTWTIGGLIHLCIYESLQLPRRVKMPRGTLLAPVSDVSAWLPLHYSDVIMSTMASQITSLTIVYPTVYSGADQRKHQSWASLAFVRGIHRWPVNYPHKGPVTRRMSPFNDVIMCIYDAKYGSVPICLSFRAMSQFSCVVISNYQCTCPL